MRRAKRPELFAITRLDAFVAEGAKGCMSLPEDGVIVSASRLRALFEAAHEDAPADGITERALGDALDVLDNLFPAAPPTRGYVRAPEGACDVLVVEEGWSRCVGCGWWPDDHDKAVREAARVGGDT